MLAWYGSEVLQHYRRDNSFAKDLFGVEDLDPNQFLARSEVETDLVGQAQSPTLVFTFKQPNVQGVHFTVRS